MVRIFGAVALFSVVVSSVVALPTPLTYGSLAIRDSSNDTSVSNSTDTYSAASNVTDNSNSTDAYSAASNVTDNSNSTDTYYAASNLNDTSSSNSTDNSNSSDNSTSVDMGDLSSDMQGALKSIGSRVSSNWRSNSGEVVIVQNVVKTLVITKTRETRVIEQQDVEQIAAQIQSFGIDVNRNDVSNVVFQQVSERSEQEILVEMLQSIVNIVDVTQTQVTEQIEESQQVVVLN